MTHPLKLEDVCFNFPFLKIFYLFHQLNDSILLYQRDSLDLNTSTDEIGFVIIQVSTISLSSIGNIITENRI